MKYAFAVVALLVSFALFTGDTQAQVAAHGQSGYGPVWVPQYHGMAYTPRVRYAPWRRATIIRHRYTPVWSMRPYKLVPMNCRCY